MKAKDVVTAALVAPIVGYRRWISPALPPHCRFTPSCSSYAIEALRVHGPVVGLWLAIRRILRCHPWNPGGHDPVPPRGSGRCNAAHQPALHRQAPHGPDGPVASSVAEQSGAAGSPSTRSLSTCSPFVCAPFACWPVVCSAPAHAVAHVGRPVTPGVSRC